ncbi:hypothetical protein ColTof4_13638 [Colletotrichum tofieldiae]|nr:hypothetical protein ColTof3_14593 [Colletotrichum tofieldiae]GKT81215.1 hypothetical protein ColTof4_13638 [Colletotrichum tofieldiae]
MPDVSASMKHSNQESWAWNTQNDMIQGMVSKAIAYDNGGIDIWPIREASQLEKMGNPTLERLLGVKDPEKALEYVRGFEDKLSSTPTRQLFAARVQDVVKKALENPNETKRTLLLISTNGNPDPGAPSMTETTKQAVMALKKAGLDPRRYLAVSYVIITMDFHTMCGYLKLKDRNTWGTADTLVECDVANAMFPVLITVLGGFTNPLANVIALGGAISSEIDKALKLIVTGPAKKLIDLMHAYVNARHHLEEY